MTDDPPELSTDRTTAVDRVPLDPDRLPELPAEQISPVRRQSRTIPPPRKWRRAGLTDIVCPECRAKVPGIQDGFWHLQTAHNQGKGVDLEAWGRDLRDELDEYITAAKGRRGYVRPPGSWELSGQSKALLTVLVLLAVVFVVYQIAGG